MNILALLFTGLFLGLVLGFNYLKLRVYVIEKKFVVIYLKELAFGCLITTNIGLACFIWTRNTMYPELKFSFNTLSLVLVTLICMGYTGYRCISIIFGPVLNKKEDDFKTTGVLSGIYCSFILIMMFIFSSDVYG